MKCEFCEQDFKNLGAHIRSCKKNPTKINENATTQKEESKPIEIKLDLESKVNELSRNLNTLAGAVNKLVEMQKIEPKKDISESDTPVIESKKDKTVDDSYMPPRYKEIIDTILSPEFKGKIVDFEDRTDFQFTIIVPRKYSSLSDNEFEISEDLRSRMIPRALGENGVKAWCELIRLNLNKHFTSKGVQSPFIK